MSNFINSAVLGNSIAQDDLFGDLVDWWNSLEPMYQYAIVAGSGLAVVTILLLLFKPAAKAEAKGLEELLRLKLMKELVE